MSTNKNTDNKNNKKTAIEVAVVTSFLTTFMSSALNLSIPAISAEFGASASYVGWIITIYTLVVAALCVPAGKLADIYGSALFLKAGLALFCVSTFICMLAPSIAILIAIRAVQGLAAAMIFATNNTILLNAHDRSEHGRVLGISTAATYIGLSAGPVIGGMINHNLGWKYIFIVAGLVSLYAFIKAYRNVADDARGIASCDTPRIAATGTANKISDCGAVPCGEYRGKQTDDYRFDLAGNLLYVPMIISFLYGISLVGDSGLAYILIGAAVILGIAFVLAEKRAASPVINIAMFTGDRQFTCSTLAALLNYGATFAISYLISIYLQMSMGFNSQTAGLILVLQPLFQAIFSPKMGKLSDRIAPYKLASAGMLCCAITLGIYAITLPQHSLVCIVGALVLGGVGFALFSSPNTNAIMSRVPPQSRAQGMSIVSTMRTVGQSLSMCIVTIITNLRLGNRSLQEVSDGELIACMRIVFVVFIVICIVGTVISAVRVVDAQEKGTDK